jgi:hypothetical protein
MLTLAGVGAAAAWLSVFIPEGIATIRREEESTGRFLRRWSFLITACLFLFSMSAMWSGLTRPGDLQGVNIGGLIGFNDAGAYLAGTHDQAKDGTWNNASSWRPLAAAFRSVLAFFAAYSMSAVSTRETD